MKIVIVQTNNNPSKPSETLNTQKEQEILKTLYQYFKKEEKK